MEYPGSQRFKLLRRLGDGTAGVVYEALDTERRERVAVRSLGTPHPAIVAYLNRELPLLARLDHPGLGVPHEILIDQDVLLCVSELIRGPDLLTYLGFTAAPSNAIYVSMDSAPPSFEAEDSPSARLARVRQAGPPVVDQRALRTALSEVCDVLRLLHETGRVHRGVKPHNMRIRPAEVGLGRAVLLDTSLISDEAIAFQLEASPRAVTAAYLAPEQVRGAPASPAADFYALGVFLFRVLTDKLPFEGVARAILAAKRAGHVPLEPLEIAPDCPPDLAELCAGMLADDPDDRPTGEEIARGLGAGGMRVPAAGQPPAPRFVGRTHELRALEAAYERSRAGALAGVVLRGAPGAGKSRLLDRLVARLRARGEQPWILRGRCPEHEAAPHGALDGPMRALARYLGELPEREASALLPRGASLLPRMFPSLGEVPAVANAPAIPGPIRDPDVLRGELLDCLRELLAILAHRRPIVIAIDDLEYCDPDSAYLLDVLLAAPRPPAALVVLAQRADARPTPGAALTAVGSGGALATAVPECAAEFQTVDLLPFAARESRAMVEAMLTRTLYDAGVSVRALDDEACGDPRHTDEMVRYAVRIGEPPWGASTDELVWARIQTLDGAARRLLEVAALAGAPVSERVLAETAGLSLVRSERVLQQLEWAGLVRYVPSGQVPGGLALEPAHPDVTLAVLDHMDDEARAAIHAELVVALVVASGEPRHHLRSRHLAALGGAATAAREAEAAGDEAFERLALERAAWLYQTAARLCDRDPERRGAIYRKLAQVLVRTGKRPQAAASFRKAAGDIADPVEASSCQISAAEEMLAAGHIERGLDALRALLEERGFDPDATRAASRVLSWGRTKLGLRRRFKLREDVEPAAIGELSLLYAAARAYSRTDILRGTSLCTRGVSAAFKAGSPGETVRLLLLEAELRAGAGGDEIAEASELVDEAAAIAERTTDPAIAGLMLSARGLLSYAAGRDRAAVAQLAEGEAALARSPDTQADAWRVRLARMAAVRRIGALADLARLNRRFLNQAKLQGDLASEVILRRRGSLLFLAQDDTERARRDLVGTSWTPIRRGYHLQHFYELVARAELDLYDNRDSGGARMTESFAALEGSLLLRVQAIRVEAAWLIGRLGVARAARATSRGVRDPDIDAGLAEAAAQIEALGREQLPQAAVYAELLRAGTAGVRRRRKDARASLDVTLAAADRAGAHLVAACARRAMGKLTAGKAGDALLRRADDWMDNEGIERPERMLRVIAPGFERT